MTNNKVQGFTLIELLVVVSILAALAGITSVAMDGYQQEAQEQITRVEMQRIANAIRRFKADTGYWPKTEASQYNYGGEPDQNSVADFSFLFKKPDEIREWSVEYAIGWHGPYIDYPAIKTIVIDTLNPNLGCAGTGAAHEAAVNNLARMDGLVDRFQQIRANNSGKEYCVVSNFNIGDIDGDDKGDWQYKVDEFSGSPYLYDIDFTHPEHSLCKEDITPPIDSTVTCIVLRSFGADGVDGFYPNAEDKDRADDIVFVLQVNE